MPAKKPSRKKVYWDTSVILAWIKDETRSPGQMENLYAVAEQIHNNTITMFSSVTAFAEIFEGNLTEDQRSKLQAVFQRSNTDLVSIDLPVSRLTSELREFYIKLARRDGRPPLCYADAQHLAAAIAYEADEFQTFDKDDKDNEKQRCRGLLTLGDSIAGYSIKVRLPSAEQLGLL